VEIDFAKLTGPERYKLLSSTVVPRPIALVSTRGANGVDNAAPFSFFNVFAESPPTVVLGLQIRADGAVKDTARNIRESGEFVINLVDRPIAEAMNVCAIDFEEEVSEFDLARVTRAPCRHVAAMRIAEAPVAFECRRTVTLQLSKQRDIVVGEVIHMHVRDGLFNPETLHIDLSQYAIVGRMFGDLYTPVETTFALERMSPDEWRRRNPGR
jgi:flavin reductase (DIM6/NTAB) family NADH-FMN oxidoreductase RutF